MSTTMIERLHRLAAVWGPSGREQKVAAAITEAIGPLVDEVRSDRFGNLIAVRRGAGGGKRVMVVAHMDTIGAIAMNINDKGLILLEPVGGLKAWNAIGQRVVWGSGVVGVIQHEPVEEAKEVSFKKLWCDIGATSRDEALENVRLGDMCTMAGDLQQMGDVVAGPGLDNRAGCTVLLEVAQHLEPINHEVVFVFACQGEVGPRGAGTAAYGIDPDLAIVVDVSATGDVPKAPRVEVRLGAGPALKLKDGNYMAHHAVGNLVRTVAEQQTIPLQTEIVASPGGHSDAQVVSIAGQGIPTAVIDIPARYRGTGTEMVSLRDMHGAADLVLKLLSSPLEWD
ncbi:MAG TPA: M42 family peptidase [Symbiobacteriaceae bacterium]|nr:M42 family peptidase [Symbiobacteriaceae bacterium]